MTKPTVSEVLVWLDQMTEIEKFATKEHWQALISVARTADGTYRGWGRLNMAQFEELGKTLEALREIDID